MTTATTKDLLWEINDGISHGYFDVPADGSTIEIEISERVVRSMWTVGTNVRYWVITDSDNEIIADGKAEGLRAAKSAAMKALNDYLKESK